MNKYFFEEGTRFPVPYEFFENLQNEYIVRFETPFKRGVIGFKITASAVEGNIQYDGQRKVQFHMDLNEYKSIFYRGLTERRESLRRNTRFPRNEPNASLEDAVDFLIDFICPRY